MGAFDKFFKTAVSKMLYPSKSVLKNLNADSKFPEKLHHFDFGQMRKILNWMVPLSNIGILKVFLP
jgi:hypothetical protein